MLMLMNAIKMLKNL